MPFSALVGVFVLFNSLFLLSVCMCCVVGFFQVVFRSGGKEATVSV